MAQKTYCGIGNIARQVPDKGYGGDDNEIARKLIKGYCGDSNNIARQFWGALGYVIFDNGEWHYVPQGFDLVQNYAETNGKVSDLSADYLTDKLLWVHEVAISNQWDVDDEDYLNSNYTDYSEQITKNEIYIPIDRISSPSKLRIIGKGNLMFTACRINNGSMVKSNLGGICSENLAVKEIDISGQAYIDYIEVLAPNEYESTNEAVTNPYVYQPIPFLIQNHLYTNNSSAYNLPGMEVNQISGGDMYCFRKYRDPDDSNQCLYMMSTAPFSVEVTYRFYNQPTYETWVADQIQTNPPVYAIIKEGYWWGYKFQNVAIWKTNYHGGWNYYWDIDVGNIVLYGDLNILALRGEISQETKSLLHYPNAYDDILPIKLMNFPFDILLNGAVQTFKLKYFEKKVYAVIFMNESTGLCTPYMFSKAPFSHTMGTSANEYWAVPIAYNGYTYYCIQWFGSYTKAPNSIVNKIDSLQQWYGWDTAHILYTGNEGKAVVTEEGYSLQQIKRIEVIGDETADN